MKQLFKTINPKKLFHLQNKKPSSTLSKSPPSSFTSNTSTSSSTATTTSSSFKFDVVSAFEILDHNGDGKIDRNELNSIFNKVLSDEELRDMIKEVDRDGDGCVSLDELRAVGSLFESTAREEDVELLMAAFEFFDADHDGRIDANELFQGFVKLGDQRCTLEDCRRMVESVDVNKDGFVCFQDFSSMMDVIPR